jgi:hypothetical protein
MAGRSSRAKSLVGRLGLVLRRLRDDPANAADALNDNHERIRSEKLKVLCW